MIADSAEPAYRGLAFGFHRAMDTVGAVLGPCLAIFLMRALEEDYRSIFLISFIPAAISVAIIFIFLRSDSPPVSRTKGSISFRLSEFKTPFKKFLLVSCIFAVGNSSDAFLILRAKGIGFTNAAVILAYVAYNITYSLSSLPFGKLSDKISRKTLIITGYVVFALVYLGFGIVKGRIEAWSLFLIYGFYMAMTEGVGKAFVTDLVDEDKRGTALGLYHSLTGFLAFFASLIAGLLWSLFGAPAAFLYGAAAAVFSCLVFVLLFRV
jgi:MFS family permease